MKKPNSICELLIIAQGEKDQDTNKILMAWLDHIKVQKDPNDEAIRKKCFEILYNDYKHGLYKIKYDGGNKNAK